MPSKQTVLSTAVRLVLAAAFAVAAQGAQAQAQSAQAKSAQAQTKAVPPAAAGKIDPKAMAILKASCAATGGAQTMSFTAVDTFQRNARDGQPLYYTVKSDVTLQRPNKLRVIKLGDGVPDEFYYDGKMVMAYVPSQDLVAVAEAPGTVDEMLDSAWEFAEIHFPFADVLVSNPCDVFDQGLKSAFVVGQSKIVGGVPTDMVAVTTDHAQGELWIGTADHLPRMIRTRYPNEPAHANYQTEYSNWRLGAPVDASTFTSTKAAGAKKIAFQPPATAGGRGATTTQSNSR